MLTRIGPRLLMASATIVVFSAVIAAQAQQPAARGGVAQNAALQYWQAFAHLPKINEQQQKLLAAPPDGSAPDPAAAELADSAKDALLYLHRGAAIGPCDWGLHLEDGPYLLLPHLGKGRDLGRLACVRARQDFANGDNARGVEAAADTIVLARHLSTDLTAIVSYLVQLNVEATAINTLAPHLAGLDAATLDALDRRLASLPRGGSLEACVKVERESFLDWAITTLRQMNDQDPWKERVLGPLAMNEAGKEQEKIDAAVEASGGTREGLLKQFVSLRSYYENLDRIVTLPREQFRAKLAEIEKQVESNPIGKAVVPTMGRVYDRDAAGRTRMTLLKAAIAVARGGPEKARDFKDASGAPIEYQAAPGGFELRSKVVDEDKPVVLKVGGKG